MGITSKDTSLQQNIRIGGASGYWGDAAFASKQLLDRGELDYLVYDYLAEITMSIMARARAVKPELGYAPDFVHAALAPNLKAIAEQGVKVISNAGGVNPKACGAAIEAVIKQQGLDLKVAVITGDDLLPKLEQLSDIKEMFSGQSFPDQGSIASVNAYLGAFAIAKAMDMGADIVVTGRCVDSAVTLASCIHAFGWQPCELDKLAQASLAGHLLECGTQVCGGNFTDWETVSDSLAEAGYPIAEVSGDGEFICTKVADTGGVVNVGTVAEQMLYEIGDPAAYHLPDVCCDFSQVKLELVAQNQVRVSGALGRGRSSSYKASMTYADGFRSGHVFTLYGRDADKKAKVVADIVFKRARAALAEHGLADFNETCVEAIGSEVHYGKNASQAQCREVDVKIAVTHESAKGVGIFLKEATGMVLAGPPGLCGFAGARPKPSPVVRLFSMLVPKAKATVQLHLNQKTLDHDVDVSDIPLSAPAVESIPQAEDDNDSVIVCLETLAFGRSGDKGNKANIGIIARHRDFIPYIAKVLSEDFVRANFAHFLERDVATSVERFYMPGCGAFNFLLHDVLGGGGVASLRNDNQGKGYAQLLLASDIAIPASLAQLHGLK